MCKLNTPLTFITILSLTAFFACSSKSSGRLDKSEIPYKTIAFPKQHIFRVTLFTLDSSQKTTIENYVDTNILEYVGGAGYSFIDKSGKPKTTNYHSYHLDSLQIIKLENFLAPRPCSDSLHLNKACAPTYRNVFVFYGKNNTSIAQVHICFECELTSFNPAEEYMCDFDNKVDYQALKRFTESIKHNP